MKTGSHLSLAFSKLRQAASAFVQQTDMAQSSCRSTLFVGSAYLDAQRFAKPGVIGGVAVKLVARNTYSFPRFTKSHAYSVFMYEVLRRSSNISCSLTFKFAHGRV